MNKITEQIDSLISLRTSKAKLKEDEELSIKELEDRIYQIVNGKWLALHPGYAIWISPYSEGWFISELSDLLDSKIVITRSIYKCDHLLEGLPKFINHETIFGGNLYDEYQMLGDIWITVWYDSWECDWFVPSDLGTLYREVSLPFTPEDYRQFCNQLSEEHGIKFVPTMLDDLKWISPDSAGGILLKYPEAKPLASADSSDGSNNFTALAVVRNQNDLIVVLSDATKNVELINPKFSEIEAQVKKLNITYMHDVESVLEYMRRKVTTHEELEDIDY